MFKSGSSSQSGGGVLGRLVGCDDDGEGLVFEPWEVEEEGFGEPAADRMSSFDEPNSCFEALLPDVVEAERWPWKPLLDAIRYCHPMLTRSRLWLAERRMCRGT